MSLRNRSNRWKAAFLAFALAGSAGAALKEGDAFPGLKTARLEGAVPDLSGKVVLVDFWASWCEPCKKSFPELEKLYRAYKARGLVVLGVSVDKDGETMRKFLETRAVAFPVVRDREKALVKIVGIDSMPTSFLIDRSGKIRFVHNGFLGEKTVSGWTKQIEELLGEQ